MPTLILCGQTEDETAEFLEAERILLDELSPQKGMDVHPRILKLRLKELPDPTDTGKTRELGRELLGAFGVDAQEFQTEFLEKNGFSFLAIYSGRSMPEKAETTISPETKRRRPIPRLLWKIPAIAAGVLTILTLLYYGTGFLLTNQVDTRYTERDCAGVTDLAASVEKFYPVNLAPFTDPAREQAEECRTYLRAENLRQEKEWEKSYQAYQVYGKKYPQGIYREEAKDQEADSLYEWASEQRSKKDFASAVDNMTLLLDNYQDTPANAKASEALPETYFEWGQDCRSKEEFSEAETVYLSLNNWAEEHGQQSISERVLAELAETYFDWGKQLQGISDFATASIKFDKAISTDPDAGAADGTAAQTRAYLPGFERAWGEHLILQGKYAEAIRHFETSVSLSSPNEKVSAQNNLTQAYLRWAQALNKTEDYNQSLTKIELASNTAVTDESRKNVEEARASTIGRFARSNGRQAEEVIFNVTSGICETGKPPTTPPIVGILEEKRLTLSGQLTVSGKKFGLPAHVLALAPGNLHFVACGEEKEITVQTCPYSWTGFGTASHWIKRIRYEWTFKVFHAQSGKSYTSKIFSGSWPASCPYRHTFVGGSYDYFYGEKPDTQVVIDWLASLLR